jgi:allantoin racemase
VVGIGEAAFQAAVTIARRFAVITTLPRSIPEIEEALDRHGMRGRCVAVEPLGIPVADQGSHNPDTTAAIVAAGRRVVSGAGAEALVLACGGMADVARTVTTEVGVPVCDGVAFGAMTAYGLWRSGLRTSKTGAYGWPEAIAYSGMPGFRART